MTRVALFVTCLVDQFFPRVGEATVELLEQAGCEVLFPEAQTCCGQPAFNSGLRDDARPLLQRFVEIFEPYDAIVTPSGSCACMTRRLGGDLLAAEPAWRARWEGVAARVFELSEFLDQRGFRSTARLEGRVAYHPSCHLLRELAVDAAPRRLLSTIDGVELLELGDAARCCGFGGLFSVKLPELSAAMMEDKLAALEASGASIVTACDAGCLMHLAGALVRRRSSLRVAHLAELLAGYGPESGSGA